MDYNMLIHGLAFVISAYAILFGLAIWLDHQAYKRKIRQQIRDRVNWEVQNVNRSNSYLGRYMDARAIRDITRDCKGARQTNGD